MAGKAHRCAGQHQAPEAWDDETARWYASKWGDHPSNAVTVALAELCPDDVVLDIGCGTGTAAREAARVVLEGRVIGIDPTPAMLEIAAEKTAPAPGRERIQFLEGSAESIPLFDASVTVALAINSIHHWQHWQCALAEVCRVLRPGGRLWITEEALRGGKCGHGDGPLSDPQFVAQGLRDTGFVHVTVGIHEEGVVKIYYIRADKGTDEAQP